MKISNIETFNFENALRGMRHPLESYDRADSKFGYVTQESEGRAIINELLTLWGDKLSVRTVDLENDSRYTFKKDAEVEEIIGIGPKDMELARKLIEGGPEHRKFLRHILVSMDITAPDYWWKEMSTYQVGVQSPNSTSTMHKIMSKDFSFDMFEMDDFKYEVEEEAFRQLLEVCQTYKDKYLETKDKRYWKALIRILPMSWLYTRTWTANYEVLRNIYHQRKDHKLTEWHTFCKMIESLPYAEWFIMS